MNDIIFPFFQAFDDAELPSSNTVLPGGSHHGGSSASSGHPPEGGGSSTPSGTCAVAGASGVSASALATVAEGSDDQMTQLMGRRQKLPVPKADTEGKPSILFV